MGILRREKIKGCLAVGDVKDGAIKEISGNCVDILFHSSNERPRKLD